MANMEIIDGFEVITPDKNSLIDPTGNNTCSVKGCDRTFKNSSALRFHLSKSHGEKTTLTSNEVKNKKYACPSIGCPRNVKSPRRSFFSLLHGLKKHYQSVHGQKKHECQKCGKLFGWEATKVVHEKRCQRLFYCSCGAYYTTLEVAQMHAYRKGSEHIVIGEDTTVVTTSKTEFSTPTMTVAAVLYIPKQPLQTQANIFLNQQSLLQNQDAIVFNSQSQQTQVSSCPQQKQTQNNVILFNNHQPQQNLALFTNQSRISISDINTATSKPPPRFIRILPKINRLSNKQQLLTNLMNPQVPHTSAHSTTVSSTSSFTPSENNLCDVSTDNQADVMMDDKLCVDYNDKQGRKKKTFKNNLQIEDKEKLSSYEKNMLYLASEEAQEILADPVLLCDTVIHKKMGIDLKQTKCRCKKEFCKHKKQTFLNLGHYYTQTGIQSTDIYNEIGSSASCLADMCTQTALLVKGIDDTTTSSSQSHVDTQTVTQIYSDPNVEVLETSDFSIQCQLAGNMANPFDAIDMQTQTDEEMNSWLNSFGLSTSTNIETQTICNDMQNAVKSNAFGESNTPLLLDKSIQLDDFWGTSNDLFLTDSINTGTQTMLNDNWISQNFESIAPNEQISMSTQTNSNYDIDFINIDFSVDKKDQTSQSFFVDSTNCLSLENQHDILMNFGDSIDPLTTAENKTKTVICTTNSSGTQTRDYFKHIFDEPANNTKNTTETQTSISFYDLLDSSFIDDYLNEKLSIETQTTQAYHPSVSMETQTNTNKDCGT